MDTGSFPSPRPEASWMPLGGVGAEPRRCTLWIKAALHRAPASTRSHANTYDSAGHRPTCPQGLALPGRGRWALAPPVTNVLQHKGSGPSSRGHGLSSAHPQRVSKLNGGVCGRRPALSGRGRKGRRGNRSLPPRSFGIRVSGPCGPLPAPGRSVRGGRRVCERLLDRRVTYGWLKPSLSARCLPLLLGFA